MMGFQVAILAAALCGFAMVAGGMVLLYKGVISLDKAGPDTALTVEFKKLLKLTTHYPALGLFVIGVVFVAISVVESKDPHLNIAGTVNGADPSQVQIAVSAGPWPVSASTGGTINDIVTPTLGVLHVLVVAPGFNPPTQKFDIRPGWLGSLRLGDVTFKNQVVPKPTVDSAKIAPAPDSLAPLASNGRF
jgi:hypothetical protein